MTVFELRLLLDGLPARWPVTMPDGKPVTMVLLSPEPHTVIVTDAEQGEKQ